MKKLWNRRSRIGRVRGETLQPFVDLIEPETTSKEVYDCSIPWRLWANVNMTRIICHCDCT